MFIMRFKIIFFLLTIPTIGFSQLPSPSYQLELGAMGQGGTQKPFWLISNQDGQFDPGQSSLFGGLYVGSEVEHQGEWFHNPMHEIPKHDTISNKKITVDYGVELFNRYNGSYDFQLNQYYADFSWWRFNLQVGAKSETFGNQYDPLSSGSLLYSGNGRPIPKVAASSDYIPLPLSKGYIEFRGYLSHGWFEKDRYTESPYLHHKNVYVRVGGDLPIHAHYGFHHYAMWGGVSPVYGQVPDGLEAYKKVFLVQRGDSIQNEIKNAYGNHLGSRNFGIDYEGQAFGLQLYWQTIFEDNSGKVWRNIKDGLWGLAYRNRGRKPLVKRALYEFLHTKDQSGRHHKIEGEIVGGNDNYFNNYLYASGWTSRGYTLGTPLITSPAIRKTSSGQKLINNRLIAHHLGLTGWLKNNLRYRMLFTYSINYGTNANPFDPVKKDYSLLAGFHYRFPNDPTWKLKAKLAGDFGSMYGPNLGVFFSLQKTANF